MKVCFLTFGCRLSRAEALDDEARYLEAGWETTDDHEQANLFVVRGCSVTARAQRDCEKTIDRLRRHHPTTRLIIRGCLESRNPPILSTSRVRAWAFLPPDDVVPSTVPTRTSRAYLKVQDGCSGTCTYCIVPHFRGKPISVPFAQVLEKAKRFLDAGYHEIVVTGCNLSLYASEEKTLPDLLTALADLALPFNCRIRLGSLEPGAGATAVIEAMASRPNVCPFLHIPVQSGSNRMLTAMHRPYLVRDVEAIVRLARARFIRPNIGCDLMTGFPGENEADFLSSKGLLERLAFSNVHVFPYSERPGTPAAAYFGVVPKALRSARAHLLARSGGEIKRKFAHSFEGHEVSVVIEDPTKHAGWTAEYLWCEGTVVAAAKDVQKKELVRMRVTKAHDGRLKGVVI